MTITGTVTSLAHDLERLATNVAQAVEPNPQHIVIELQRIASRMDRVVATLRARKAVRA